MTRSAKLVRTLVYYDGAQLAVAKDQVGQLYLCLLAERTSGQDTFLLVPVSEERLAALLNSEIDLLAAFGTPESGEWFSVSGMNELEESPISALEELPPEWLPEAGVVLNVLMGIDTDDSILVTESAKTRRAILHLHLAPPESKSESRIGAKRLAQGLAVFQELVKQSYASIVGEQTGAEKVTAGDPYTMDVFAFSPGSFTVHLQSRQQIDMLDHIELDSALTRVDNLMENLQDTKQALNAVSESPEALVRAYAGLLRYVAENESPLSYRWTSPSHTTVDRREMTPAQAENLYERLKEEPQLAGEEVSIRGVFFRANVESGKWAMHDDAGESYHGKLSKDSGASLSGVVLDTKRYELQCTRLFGESNTRASISELVLTSLREL